MTDHSAERLQDFVIIRLADEYFAFDTRDVAEVLPYTEPARLPRAPKFISGMVAVRGHLLPVVDLRVLVGVDARAAPHRILALRLGERFLGVSVDEVCEIYAADETRIDHRDTLGGGGRGAAPYVSRALRREQRVIPVLDVTRLLTSAEAGRLARLRPPRRPRDPQ